MARDGRPRGTSLGRGWLTLLTALAILGACAPEGSEDPFREAAPSPATTDPGATTPTETPPPTAPTAADEEGPNAGIFGFTAQDIDGEPIDASSYAARDVAVWFWAPW